MCYIDPPFNTEDIFPHYDDNLEHSVWLTMMRDRLLKLRTLLAREGTVWIHIDDNEAHRVRCVLDEIFGIQNFVADITWEKMTSPKMDSKYFSSSNDHIIVYRNSDDTQLNKIEAPTDDTKGYQRDEEGRLYTWGLLRMDGSRKSSFREHAQSLYFGIENPEGEMMFPIRPDGKDGAWRWSKEKVESEGHLLRWKKKKDGLWEIYRRKYKQTHRPPTTIWLSDEVGNTAVAAKESNQLFNRSAFSTPKPESLLERIIHIGTDPGDLVLDYFAGSGTTAAVAHKMGRKWIGVERSKEIFEDYTLPRMVKVVNGQDPGGVSADYRWNGGGSFRILEVQPSIFAIDSYGIVHLANTNHTQLTKSIAAHLEFDFCLDQPPFVGRKGNSYLSVIDGMVSKQVVEELLSHIDPDHTLTLAATAVAPDAERFLYQHSPGSKLIQVPGDILNDYRQKYQTSYRDTTRHQGQTETGHQLYLES